MKPKKKIIRINRLGQAAATMLMAMSGLIAASKTEAQEFPLPLIPPPPLVLDQFEVAALAGPPSRVVPAINLALIGPWDDQRTTVLVKKGNASSSILDAIRKENDPRQYLKDELRAQLFRALPGRGEDVILGEPKLPMTLRIPPGDWTVRYEFALPARGVGTVTFTGFIARRGLPIQRFNGALLMERMATGVRARRLIRRGEIISQSDLETVDAPLSQLPRDAFPSKDQLTGTAARSEIRPGTWITGHMLKLPTVIKSRQIVKLKLTNGPIEITAQGMAKQSGAIGEIIRVENLHSKRELLARVVSKDQLEVIF